jgi:hypothetical protein
MRKLRTSSQYQAKVKAKDIDKAKVEVEAKDEKVENK